MDRAQDDVVEAEFLAFDRPRRRREFVEEAVLRNLFVSFILVDLLVVQSPVYRVPWLSVRCCWALVGLKACQLAVAGIGALRGPAEVRFLSLKHWQWVKAAAETAVAVLFILGTLLKRSDDGIVACFTYHVVVFEMDDAGYLLHKEKRGLVRFFFAAVIAIYLSIPGAAPLSSSTFVLGSGVWTCLVAWGASSSKLREQGRRYTWAAASRAHLFRLRIEAAAAPTLEEQQAAAAALDCTPDEAAVLAAWRVPWSDVTMEEPVGSGASADVWKARVANVGVVAVKRLHREKQSDAESLTRFRGEILTMARLKHYCVAKFVGAVWEPPHVALVMAYFARGSLARLLWRDLKEPGRQEALGWARPLWSWAQDVATGMQYLHAQVGAAGQLGGRGAGARLR